MSGRVFSVSKEQQGRERIAQLRREIDEIQPESAAPADPPDEDKELKNMIETELKQQLRSPDDKTRGWAVVNGIKFLAVKARLPMQFGGELDQ